jgi:sortase A
MTHVRIFSRISAFILATSVASVVSPVVATESVHAASNTPSTRTDAPATKEQPLAVVWIARLGVKSPVYRGVSQPVFKRGIGWYPGTALPGRSGNMVLGGHRVTWPSPFRHIDSLAIGDRILVKYKSAYFTYIVTKKMIVKPTATWILSQSVRQPTLTMFACHPAGSYRQRYVVTAVLKK